MKPDLPIIDADHHLWDHQKALLAGLPPLRHGFMDVLHNVPRYLPDETSAMLAAQWRPYVETCIEAFGAQRAMFESNVPVDRFGASHVALWNAFKRLAAGCSADEKTALFSGTAARVYRIAA